MVCLNKATYEDNEEWFMDSGSSCHMTGMTSLFLSFLDIDTDCYVGSRTNNRHAIKGFGYVIFQVDSGRFFGIEHMLYVWDLKVNITLNCNFWIWRICSCIPGCPSTCVFKGSYSRYKNSTWCSQGEVI